MNETTAPIRKRRLGVKAGILAMVGVIAVTAAACAGPPIDPNNRPSIPGGVSNGQLPGYMLANVSGAVVHRDAANATRAMLDAARNAGVSLYVSSSYRDYSGQVAMRNSWCSRGACHMAAVPGTSNHGWGKAMDLGSATGMTFGSTAYNWLKNNGWQYGYNHPGWAEPNGSSPEAWHWEWVGDGGQLYPGRRIGPA